MNIMLACSNQNLNKFEQIFCFLWTIGWSIYGIIWIKIGCETYILIGIDLIVQPSGVFVTLIWIAFDSIMQPIGVFIGMRTRGHSN